MATRPILCFLSSSPRDAAARVDLQAHLSGLVREDLLRLWTPEDLAPGQERALETHERLARADLILLLLSANYVSSEACVQELEQALGQRSSRVIPIFARPVDWQDERLERLGALPEDGEAVSSFTDQDGAWAAVAAGVRRAAEELLQVSAGGAALKAVRRPPPRAAQSAVFLMPPLPPQGVTGRDEELATLLDLFGPTTARGAPGAPVALRGMGGIGKTTLAIALAHAAPTAELFPAGVLWASLGPEPSLRPLLDGWGRALGVDLRPERDAEACRDRLRTALHARRMLLIVDDVWSTAHARCFQVAGPACGLLITTRELPVAHDLATRQRTLRVEVLQPGPALALLRRIAPDAVAADEGGARRLCERLEHLPLGLTLAARLLANEAEVPARMQRLLAELLVDREARLQLLQAEGRPGLAVDQPVSLQAILGMSVKRLSQLDQQRFASLSVFGGEPLTWELRAAAYVWDCSQDEAEETTSRLIHRGLVEQRRGTYFMHALLADFAQELFERAGLEHVRLRHARCYLDLE